MLRCAFIFFSVTVILIGSLAQQSPLNGRNEKNDKQNQLTGRILRQAQQSNNTISGYNIGSNNSTQRRWPIGLYLSTSVECKPDVHKYCIKGTWRPMTNLKVLQCIDDLDNAANLISKECQNVIYKFKYNMTHNVHFDDGAIKICAKDIKQLEECNELTDERGSGRLISCLYERLPNITEPSCRTYVNQLQAFIFTDWRLSEYFATACLQDITDLKCGRLDDENNSLPHNQGVVIACLSKKYSQLSKPCLKNIGRLHEMQSNDYHLDRALFSACREDRERFCAQITSGDGRVYRCLYEQKFNSMMSTDCRKEIHRRQKVVVENALLDAPLVKACASEMREHQCVANPNDPDKQLSLVNLLACLEDRIKKGNQIKEDCRREMLTHRRMLMSDYAISPQLISQCTVEMTKHCSEFFKKGASGSIDQRSGKMIHCLLNALRKKKEFTPDCSNTIKSLIRAADPGNDIRADPLVETACRPVIDTLCAKVKPGDSNVIMCLLDNIKHARMTEECEDRLLEVSYFMTRDWRLTPRLVRSCHANLVQLCELPETWSINDNMTDVQLGDYLSCLYRHKQELTLDCRTEFVRIMRIRTQSIDLMPEIEDNCILDLANCQNPDIKGGEIKCLQTRYEKLEDQCKNAVKKFTKMTINDPSFDFLLMKSCEPMIQVFCPNIAKNNKNDVMTCLIKNKNNQKMDFRCRTHIEHHQIISLKDAAFLSDQFRTKCDQEINTHCSQMKTKASVVQCLANLVLKDVLKKGNQINLDCRNEIKLELLQRNENINLDPLLAKACVNDIKNLCASKSTGNAQVIDCLKANHNRVSRICYDRLRKREKLDVVLPETDYSLTAKCSSIIQKHCSNEKKENVLLCLRRHINHENTPNACRYVLYHRFMILNSDYRFNKGLIENCANDIYKYCQLETMDDDNDGDESDDDNNDNNGTNDDQIIDRDMGGRVIGCLRTKYANSHIQLEQSCITELIDVIQTSKLDVQMDIKLYDKCKTIINTNCSGVDKEDCLKLLYQNKQLTDQGCKLEVLRIIKEGQADIHVDPMLSTACQLDVMKYCNDIPIGSGKQLQCLLKKKNSVTGNCRATLLKRQELWASISHVDDINDLANQIIYSENNTYLFIILGIGILVVFIGGFICRSCIRQKNLHNYKRVQ